MHTALIVPPPEATAPAADTVAGAVYEARLYNLAEYVDYSGGWASTRHDERTQGSFDLLILAKLDGWPNDSDIDGFIGQYAKARAATVVVDWTDLIDFDGSNLEQVLARSRGGTDEDLETIRSATSSVAKKTPGPASGLRQIPAAGGLAPVVVACGDQILVLSVRRGQIDAQPATWGGLDVVDADDNATWAISADGRAAVVLHDGVMTPHWLSAAGGRPYLVDAFPAQVIPSTVGPNARLITLALLHSDVLRMSVADESQVWRLFVRPEDESSPEVIASGAGRVRTGVDMVGFLQLFDEEGRRIVGRGPSTFGGITKIRAVDASVVGGRGVAAVLGSDASGPTLAVFRQGASGTLEFLDVAPRFNAGGIDPADVSDVRVERRLDNVEPRRLLVVAGGRVHVINFDTSDAPTSSVAEAEGV